jgi:hypothetical protein
MKVPFIVLVTLFSTLLLLRAFADHDLGQDPNSSNSGTRPPAAAPTVSAPAVEQKFQHIQANGRISAPDQTPTEFTEKEINDYIVSSKVNLPAGVQSVVFEGHPGVIRGTARVDFDEIETGRSSANPLLSVFSGVHNVMVVARAYGAGGQGFVHVESVSLDDVDIPHFVLEMFVDKFLRPKYPNIGIDSKFRLRDRLDTASVGLHTLTVTQK